MNTSAIINTVNLAVGYCIKGKTKTVLSGLNLLLESGKLTCILGANGTGKSTLLRTLSGLQAPLEGSIMLHEKVSLADLTKQELSRLISIVNTDYASVGALTVDEVVSLGRYPYTGFFGVLSREDKKVVEKAINAVGMNDYKQRHIATLSDGERQKVMIARALAQNTPVIILDEPTSFLDAASRIEILGLLKNLAGEQSKAILVSTHDISPAISLSDNLWLITSAGRFITGTTAEITADATTMNSIFDNRNVTFDTEKQDFRAKNSLS